MNIGGWSLLFFSSLVSISFGVLDFFPFSEKLLRYLEAAITSPWNFLFLKLISLVASTYHTPMSLASGLAVWLITGSFQQHFGSHLMSSLWEAVPTIDPQRHSASPNAAHGQETQEIFAE